jgi:hypothetical protein
MSKTVALIFVFTFLAASCLIIVNLASVTPQDTTLDFLAAVAGVDVAKYKVEEVEVTEIGGVSFDQTVRYRLEADGSKMEVVSNLRNGTIVWCKIYRLEGSQVLLKVPAVDALDSAKNLLSNYQSASNASYLQPMQDSLSTLTELKSMTKQTSNMKLEIKNEGNLSQFSWKDTVNGIEIPQKTMGLVFYNGIFEMFSDHWTVYTVGNADVKFDREEAIQVAKEHAQRYSYTFGNTVVSNLTILDEYIAARLTMQDREKN